MTPNRKTLTAVLVLITSAFLIAAAPVTNSVAPDPTEFGPLETTSAEYKFPAAIDPDVLSARATELWARVYRPVDLSAGPYPLLIFLHGNHATCGRGENPRIDDNSQYTTTGTCPAGYVVVPNHDGYAYLAERLASWGYIVVSINANRGINAGAGVPGDSGLNLARGRLVLKHLQRLSEWNTVGGTPKELGVDLLGLLDFSRVGLMGHSRGGEGMRAAYNLYRDADSPWPAQIPDPINFQGIFEIGPVDGQTSRVLNADGTVWTVLLPMCDGDVSNLQGIRPFDRMMRIFFKSAATQKSTYTVWGANHNFYNTEWQVSDGPVTPTCLGHTPLFPRFIGSPEQQLTGLASVMAFFRGNVGPSADPAFNQNFNPLFGLPDVVTSVTRVDRGFTISPSSELTAVFEDFDQPTGTSSYGIPNEASNIMITHGSVPRHDPVQRAGVISWNSSGADVYFQTNWRAEGEGGDISAYKTLDLRLSRQNSALNPAEPTDFSIQLALADGSLSAPVLLSTYTDLRGPVGGPGGLHPILQTARIPLTDFGKVDLTQVRGVRLTFDGTPTGAIYVANARLATLIGTGGDAISALLSGANRWSASQVVGANNEMVNHAGKITSIQIVPSGDAPDKQSVEIEVFSDQELPVRGELAVLRIGEQEFVLSRYPENGDTHTLIFTLTPEEFAQTGAGEAVTVQYGRGGGSNERWNFGLLDKGRLNK